MVKRKMPTRRVYVITKDYKKKKYYISSHWKPSEARKFVKETKLGGIYANVLNKTQRKQLSKHKHITKKLITKIKRKY